MAIDGTIRAEVQAYTAKQSVDEPFVQVQRQEGLFQGQKVQVTDANSAVANAAEEVGSVVVSPGVPASGAAKQPPPMVRDSIRPARRTKDRGVESVLIRRKAERPATLARKGIRTKSLRTHPIRGGRPGIAAPTSQT